MLLFRSALPKVAGRHTTEAPCEPRLVACGGIIVDNTFGRHLIDQGNGAAERRLCLVGLALIDRRAQYLERPSKTGSESAIPFSPDNILSLRFQRVLVIGQRALIPFNMSGC